MKALVLSGGGSRGAWSGGVIEYLLKEKNKNWDIVIGASTGSLLAPLSAIGEIDRLKDIYTSVNNESIFSINPYNKKGKIKFFNALIRVIKNKKSLGEGNNLKKTIKSVFNIVDFKKSIDMGKKIYITVSNMTKFQTEYKLQQNESYDEFCDWMLASSSVPMLFDVFKKGDSEYLDGALLEPIPIQKAIDLGANEIDVVVLSTPVNENLTPMENMFDVASRVIDLMNREINKDDILLGQLSGELMEIKINIYRIPYKITDNCLIFDKNEMSKWWDMGYQFAKDENEKNITLKRTKSNNRYNQK